MASAIGDLPNALSALVVEIIGKSDPKLLRLLESSLTPTHEDRERVEDILSNELILNLNEDGQITERGSMIQRTIEEFLFRFPIGEN